jgi:hypothetical protein
MKLFLATHTGMSPDAFQKTASDWLLTAQHPRFHRPNTQGVFQPMLGLPAYLRANEFKIYIVSGGEHEFMRPFTEKFYGIPTEQVVGTQFTSVYKVNGGVPEIVRLSEILSIDDGPGKPESIKRIIGRRPSPRSATLTATSRCSNGPAPAQGQTLSYLFTTPTSTVSTPMTVSPLWGTSIRVLPKPHKSTGSWST